MTTRDVIRAWRDPDFRAGLTNDQRSALPKHPSGLIDLKDDDLSDVAAGATTLPCTIVITVTANFSCWFACNTTMWDGTCGALSYGCCSS
jgi:mersacidin/lichenicidin family type 2 lantibiotic